MIDLSIVMPCLDEAETIGSCISKARHSLEIFKLAAEIVVADNCNPDGSVGIAERLGAHVVYVKDKGYSNALRGGIEAARGKWIIMGDADNSYDFGHIAPFIEILKEGATW